MQKIIPGITMKTTSAKHGQNMFCACIFHGNFMNNLLSYCGLIDAKIRASDKDLPVQLNFGLFNLSDK
jgi:hypothetical protein